MGKLEFGSAFSKVFDLYGKHAAPLLIWSAVVQLVISLITALFVTIILTGAGLGGALLAGAVLAALAVVASAVLTGAYIVGLDDAETTGTFPSFSEVLPRVKPRLGALIVTSILAGLGVALGMLLLIVPGLVLLTWWAVAAPVVMLEGKSGPSALGRSRELVRGHGWTVFGLIFVTFLITSLAGNLIGGIVGNVLGGSEEFLGAFGGNFVSGTLTAPISALLAVVIYRALAGRDAGEGVADPYGAAPEQQLPPTGQPGTQPGGSAPDDHSGPFV